MNRLTSSIALFLFCAGLTLGIALASWLSILPTAIGAFIGGGVVAWLGRKAPKRDRIIAIFILLIATSLGAIRTWTIGPGANSVANDTGHRVIIEGLVTSTDLTDTGVNYTVTDLSIDGTSRDDKTLVRAPISSTAIIGDRIQTACSLDKPEAFDGFAYDRFLLAKSIYAICAPSAAPFIIENPDVNTIRVQFWKFVGATHSFIDSRTRAILPEPQATLLLGLLIGENSFSETWKTAFKKTGTSHIVAASGYNVAVVAELALIALVTLGLYRKQAFPLVIIAIGFFVILAGAGAAVIRAGVMGILALTARHVGRHTSPRNIIALTVAVMLVIEPRLLRDDVGFQLSIAATIGLILLTDRITPLLKDIVPSTFGIRESLASTIAATIATLPITLISFGALSTVAPLVNMLVLPFIPYAMSLGALAIVGTSILPHLGVWLALPSWTALVTMTSIIHAFSRLPFAYIPLHPSTGIALSFIAFLLVILIIKKLPQAFERELDSLQWKNALAILGVFALLFAGNLTLIAVHADKFHPATIHVWMFDIGQGDGILIDTPSGDIVIDGGPTRFGMVEHMATVRFPWERHLDAVIATHPHADHIIGLIGLIKTYSVDEILDNGSIYSSPSEEALTSGPPPSQGGAGGGRSIATSTHTPWSLGPDTSLKILWPTDTTMDTISSNVHERSIVALLQVGSKTMLFTGDAEADVESKLGNIGHIDILKVGHHGSDTSSSLPFLENITPSFALISVGKANTYGHPSPFTLGRLESIGSKIFRTDLLGDIRVDMTADDILLK